MSKKVIRKIERAIVSEMSDSNFNPNDIQISIVANKAVLQMTYSVIWGRKEIKHSDVRKMMKIAKKILKDNEVKVMALSSKRKEAIKNIKIEKRLKKVRFAMVIPAYANLGVF